jgi:antitoxin component YwqK of YwqJK toxin-antitoxin module
MRYFPAAIFLFLGTVCFGQSVRFKLYQTGSCSPKERLDTAYALYKAPFSSDTAFIPKKGIADLPGIGKYRIYLHNGHVVDTTIDIRDTGLFILRYREPDIGRYPGGLDMAPVYVSCGKLVNGYFEAFYPNGKIKLRGNFVGGYPRDSLVTYYANGALESKERIYKKETVVEKFDSLSRRTKIIESQNGPVMIYRWRKSTEFFPDGSISLKESDIRHIYTIRAYYPNGRKKIKQTKKRRVEYQDNGVKTLVCRRRQKLELFDVHIKYMNDYLFHKKEYDERGKLVQITVYECYARSGFPNWGSYEADWIVNLKKFKDGKVTYQLSDVAAKDYQNDLR